jgi:signal transduction histidine kinase
MIVFLTFVVKEGIRDNVKDKVDSLHSALNVYQIREDAQGNDERINTFYDVTAHRITTPLSSAKNFLETEEGLYGLSERVKRYNETVFNLADELPQDASLSKELDELRKAVAGTDSALNYVVDLYTNPAGRSKSVQQELVNEGASDAADALYQALQKAALVGSHVKEKAKETIQKLEVSYRRVTLASYALYCLGWGLGLLGKLYGVPTGDE